jgi:hypothetical protein
MNARLIAVLAVMLALHGALPAAAQQLQATGRPPFAPFDGKGNNLANPAWK